MRKHLEPVRVVCTDARLATWLGQLLNHTEPSCEVLHQARDCSAAPLCRWLGTLQMGQAGEVQAALTEAVEILEKTRHAFRSRDLGLLRRRLEALLEELSAESR